MPRVAIDGYFERLSLRVLYGGVV